jgi:hypothetical protein
MSLVLLGIRAPQQVERDPWLGALFENLVIVDVLKQQFNRGLPGDLYFFRGLRSFARLFSEAVTSGGVIYGGIQAQPRSDWPVTLSSLQLP